MIKESTNKSTLHLIDRNQNQNIYLYVDSVTFGLKTKNICTYILSEKNVFYTIIYVYYNSVQLICLNELNDSLMTELVEFIKPFRRISGPTQLLTKLNKFLFYRQTDGFIMEYHCDELSIYSVCEQATKKDYQEIANLVCNDESFAGVYDIDNYIKQIGERHLEYNCENWIIRDNGNIVSHFATYAVGNLVAVLSGMVTKKGYRGKGFGSILVKHLSSRVASTGKKAVIYCYEDYYLTWYQKLGYEIIGTSSKLEKDSC